MFHVEQIGFKKLISYIKNRPIQILAYLFFLSIPFQIRKVLFVFGPEVNNFFPEWESVFIYASDIVWLLFICVAVFFVIRNKIRVASKYQIYIAILLFTSVIIGLWTNFNWVSLYRFVVILQVILIAFIAVIYRNKLKWAFLYSSFATAIWTSVIGIVQFAIQRSIGVRWLFESILSVDLNNVAKVVTPDAVYLRAYSIFPHPNVFAFFLLIGLVSGIVILLSCKKNRGRIVALISNALIGVALFFTFSRSVWVVALLSLLAISAYIFYRKRGESGIYKSEESLRQGNIFEKLLKNVPRGTFFMQMVLLLIILIALGWIYFPLVFSRVTSYDANGDIALTARISALEWGSRALQKNELFGVGTGNYVSWLRANHADLEYWEYQPVPNSLILLIAETGFVGFFLVTLFFVLIMIRGTNMLRGYYVKQKMFHVEHFVDFALFILFISILLLSLFDHYVWTSHQVVLVSAVVLGLSFNNKK